MFTSHSLILSILAIIGIIFIFYLLRRSVLHPSYALWWSFISIFLFFIGLFPDVIDGISHFLGFSSFSMLFMALVFFIILIRLLLADIERTHMKIQIKRLTQQQANVLYRMKNVEQLMETEEKK